MNHLYRKFFIALSVFGVLNPKSKAQASEELPVQLKPLQAQIETVLDQYARTNTGEGRWQEAQAATTTQKQRFLPTLSAGAQLNRGQSEYLDGGISKLSGPSTTALQLNLALRQNLFNGGSDLSRLSLAEKRERLAGLNLTQARRAHIRSWLKDLAEIRYQKHVVKFQNEALQQAKALNALAVRKQSSGFLGRRDVLDSQRELLRVEQEVQNTENQLSELIERHKNVYGIDPRDVPADGYSALLQSAVEESTATRDDGALKDFLSGLLPSEIAALDRAAAEDELSLTSGSRFAPRLDAVLQAGQNRQLAGRSSNTPSSSNTSSTDFDTTRTWSISLAGEIALNPPNAFGAVEESRQRIATAQRAEQLTRKELITQWSSSRTRFAQVKSQKKNFEQLVQTTQQLRDQNQRLFEAGELSIDRLIASQQDLNRDKMTLAGIDREELRLAIELALARIWRLSPGTINTAGLP